jgi:Uncharacterised nucleotidyltransferase
MSPGLLQNAPTTEATSRNACIELLRAIARPSATDTRICELAHSIRDWDELLGVARAHRVLPLLSSRLTEAGAPLPLEARQRLELQNQRNVFHCMANAAELIAILETFEAHAIPAMPFKGVALAASVYGDASARNAGDLDLLVYSRDLKQATGLLLDRGYELQTPVLADLSPMNPETYEFHFERPRDGMVAELRTRLELLGPRFDRDLGMDWVWPRRGSAILAGATVPDIDPETTLLMLCMHGSKHIWARLAWIIDVSRLLAARPDLNWEAIDREARRTGLWRSLALGVLLAHRVTGAEVPQAVLHCFESAGGVCALAQHIDENLFDSRLPKPPGFMPYAIRILSIRDRLRLVFSPSLFRPNNLDRAFLALPRPLHALYYLVRPLRLLVDRSPR